MRTSVSTDKEISIIERRGLLTSLETLNEGQKALGKAATKEAEKAGKAEGERIAGELANASETTYVGVVNHPGGDDGKVLSAAMTVVCSKCPAVAVFLLSNAGGKLAMLATVPKDMQKSLSAAN